MTDFNIKIMAQKLGKDLEKLSDELDRELNNAVRDIANVAYASILADAQQKLHSTRQDYINSLNFEQFGDSSYIISLEGAWANALEEGFPGYDMREKMLNSNAKVKSGPNAGQDWVRTSKKGKKYAYVPFNVKPYAASTGSSISEMIKQKYVKNSRGRKQKFTSIFKDGTGKAISGKVATASGFGNSDLNGITKFQQVLDSGAVSSVYMTWRVISEDSSGWQHPGFTGIHALDDAEKLVERELNNILNILL